MRQFLSSLAQISSGSENLTPIASKMERSSTDETHILSKAAFRNAKVRLKLNFENLNSFPSRKNFGRMQLPRDFFPPLREAVSLSRLHDFWPYFLRQRNPPGTPRCLRKIFWNWFEKFDSTLRFSCNCTSTCDSSELTMSSGSDQLSQLDQFSHLFQLSQFSGFSLLIKRLNQFLKISSEKSPVRVPLTDNQRSRRRIDQFSLHRNEFSRRNNRRKAALSVRALHVRRRREHCFLSRLFRADDHHLFRKINDQYNVDFPGW